MAARWIRPVRALRVLLACVFLWFGAASPAPREVWNDAAVVVVVDGASAREQESEHGDVETDDEAQATLIPHTSRGTSRPRQTRVRRPTRDLYLRNCALLC